MWRWPNTLMVQAIGGVTNVLDRSHIWVNLAINWVATGIAAIHRAVHAEMFATTWMVLPGTLWRLRSDSGPNIHRNSAITYRSEAYGHP